MNQKVIKNRCAVIIGKFQFHELQKVQVDLIKSVSEKHEKTIIVLGLSPIRNSLNNPLDFKQRKTAILEQIPDIEIHYIEDNRDDVVWSKNLDKQIERWAKGFESVTIYGTKDKLVNVYSGKYKTFELESDVFISSAEIRKNLLTSYHPSKDFRAGIIAATELKFPTCYTTVDIAIFDMSKNRVLLARKPGETKYRFVGGFSDPISNSYEDDASRELFEETGLSVDAKDMIYVGTSKIDDWRYRGSADCIKTIFYVAPYVQGTPVANDDIEEVKWFSLKSLTKDVVVYEHEVLVEKFQKWFNSTLPTEKTVVKNKTLLCG